jgi:hypothetical protein
MEKVLLWVMLYMQIKYVPPITKLRIMLHRYHSFHGRQSTILNLEVEFLYLIRIFFVQGSKTEIVQVLYREGNRKLKFV